MEYENRPRPPDLAWGRVHEICGSGRRAFAAIRAPMGNRPVIWIVAPRSKTRLCPLGLARFFDPARLVVAMPAGPKEVLWCMEEALRGASGFVVAELSEPADLTESRRLQLAAKAGGSTGLCLIPDRPANTAAETRWRSTPLLSSTDSTLHRWELIKNKKGITGAWEVCWDAASRSLRVVCASGGGACASPRRDARCLEALGRWCERYSPWIALDRTDGLILDITGCAHLLGGEHALLNDLTMRLAAMRLTPHVGLADTKRAAKGLARFAGPVGIAEPGRTREAVTELPVAALGIGAETAATLARLGLRRIGDIDGMPRGALARRFGADLVLYMDQMLGAEPDPLSPTAFEAPHAVRLSLPEPIGKTGDVAAALRRLLDRLCDRLERERQGARAFRLWVQCCDGGGDAAEISLARPSHDPERIAPLFEPAIETLDAGFGIDALRLEALDVEPLKPEQGSAWNGASRHDAALGDLIARIGNRIGFDRVIRFQPAESHIPERAYTVAAAAYSEPARFPDSGAMRPIALFTPEPVQAEDAAIPPDRFQWRRELFETAHAQGPERIAPEWWWDDPAWRSGPRDYWRVQTRQGARLWLYQTHGPKNAGWFAQGEFA